MQVSRGVMTTHRTVYRLLVGWLEIFAVWVWGVDGLASARTSPKVPGINLRHPRGSRSLDIRRMPPSAFGQRSWLSPSARRTPPPVAPRSRIDSRKVTLAMTIPSSLGCTCTRTQKSAERSSVPSNSGHHEKHHHKLLNSLTAEIGLSERACKTIVITSIHELFQKLLQG